jgi:hypothetical protein
MCLLVTPAQLNGRPMPGLPSAVLLPLPHGTPSLGLLPEGAEVLLLLPNRAADPAGRVGP